MKTTAIQALWADTTSAGGVSHRIQYGSSPKGPEGRHSLREDRDTDVCRPSGPLSLLMAFPGPHGPGKGCVGPSGPSSHRRGAASIVAIAVLVILAGILAQQTRRVVMERRQMRNEVAYLQTEKLAEAGWLLAQNSKAKDPAWSGVTWNLQPGSIHQTNSAEVVIKVQEESCTIVARYPTNAEIPFQVTRTRKLAP